MSQSAPGPNWTLRPAEPADEPFLEKLFCQVHASDFAAVPLPEEQVLGLLRMQARAQRMSYLRDFPVAQSSIVVSGGESVGRLLVDDRAAALHLIDIAILPHWQGQGIGTRLLQDLQQSARERGVSLRLTVLPQNPALKLYTRMGFRVTGGGTHLGMEWTPPNEDEAPQELQTSENTAQSGADANAGEDQAALFSRLVGRQFQPADFPFALTLDRVQHHRAIGVASFSLFFLGPLQPYMPQGNHPLHLLDGRRQPERHFAIFMGPVGPEGDAMLYEAVFNL